MTLVVLGMFFGCRTEDAMNPARISIVMHDMPVDYDSVFVEIVGVELHSESTGWISLNTQTGIYDLLELQNGVSASLVLPQDFPAGQISQVRFILGSNNSLFIGPVEFPLELSSQDESGLKLNVHQYLAPGTLYTLIADFDASESIHVNGNGTYKLKPVIRASFQ